MKKSEAIREKFFSLTAIDNSTVVAAAKECGVTTNTGQNWVKADWYQERLAKLAEGRRDKDAQWELERDAFRDRQRDQIPIMIRNLDKIDEIMERGTRLFTSGGQVQERDLTPKDWNDLAMARLRLQEALRTATGEITMEKSEIARAGKPEAPTVDFAAILVQLSLDQKKEIASARGIQIETDNFDVFPDR